MVDRVLRAVGRAGLSQEQQDNLAVAVAEALSNAALHGNKLESRRQVRVCVEVHAARRRHGRGDRLGARVRLRLGVATRRIPPACSSPAAAACS